MADEDIESGGQTDDSDAGGEEPEADTGDEGGGERQAAKPEAGDKGESPRKQRRAHAMREATIAREAAVREAAELRARVQAAEQAAQDVQRRLEERERSSQTQSESQKNQARITQLRGQAKSHLGLSGQYAAAGRTADADREWAEFERLNDEANDIRNEMKDAERWEKRKGEIAGQLPNQGLMEEKQYIQAKYPWVATSHEGRSLADGRFAALVANGRPPTRQTMEEAITYAAKMLRLGGGGTQSPASRNAYVGVGGRDGEGDGGGTGGTMTAEDVRNNLGLKRMALSLYNNLDEQQAYAKFAKDIGTKALRE